MEDYVKSRFEEIEHQFELIKLFYEAKSEMRKPFLFADNENQNIEFAEARKVLKTENLSKKTEKNK